jgi:hypothetical protein
MTIYACAETGFTQVEVVATIYTTPWIFGPPLSVGNGARGAPQGAPAGRCCDRRKLIILQVLAAPKRIAKV